MDARSTQPLMGDKVEDKREREVAHPDASADLTAVVGANLRRLRTKRGLSLERLARLSGVSRAMLSQIELGQSTPTINVIWKISLAFGVPFSAFVGEQPSGNAVLLPADRSKVLMSHDGAFSSRALFPFDGSRSVEFYELKLRAGGQEEADAHPAGTVENIVVNQGALELSVGGETFFARQGDALLFQADRPHVYRNPGAVDALMYLVVTYAGPVG